jgi:hypothetical protein
MDRTRLDAAAGRRARSGLLVVALGAALAGAATTAAQAPPSSPSPPLERVSLPPAALREAKSLLEAEPAGWQDVQPRADLAGWVRGAWPPATALGPQQWSVDPVSGHLVCDGQGGHEWLRLDRELGSAAFHVEWRFTPVEGADKYNSGVFARNAADASVWHQAQVGLAGGYLFGATPVDGAVKRVTQAAAAARVRPAGEWNAYEVVARGRVLALWVNGAVTSEIAVDVPRGYFGLEAEGWRIEFRNLKVKSLD